MFQQQKDHTHIRACLGVHIRGAQRRDGIPRLQIDGADSVVEGVGHVQEPAGGVEAQALI